MDTEDDEEEILGYRSLPIKAPCNGSTDFLVKPFSLTIAYVDSDIAGKMAGENNTQLFSWYWPGDDESILLMVTSIVNRTILSIVNAAIVGLPDPSWKIRELWGCRQEPNGEGGPHPCDVTQIINKNPAAGWVKVAIKFNNPTLFCIIHHGQQADGTSGAQTPMRGGHNYLPLDDILPPPAKDMIDDIGEESDDDAEMQRPNPRRLPRAKTGFQKYDQKLKRRII